MAGNFGQAENERPSTFSLLWSYMPSLWKCWRVSCSSILQLWLDVFSMEKGQALAPATPKYVLLIYSHPGFAKREKRRSTKNAKSFSSRSCVFDLGGKKQKNFRQCWKNSWGYFQEISDTILHYIVFPWKRSAGLWCCNLKNRLACIYGSLVSILVCSFPFACWRQLSAYGIGSWLVNCCRVASSWGGGAVLLGFWSVLFACWLFCCLRLSPVMAWLADCLVWLSLGLVLVF